MFVNGGGCVKGDFATVRIPTMRPARRSRARPPLRPLGSLAALVAVTLLESGCGGDDSSSTTTEIPGGADPEAVRVIDEWAKTLSEGDIKGAAEFFAVPSVATNGPTFEIESPEDARAFNAALPCGARLVEAHPRGEFVIAVFRLTERPGPGTCGPGVGQKAATAFVISSVGKITEWHRVASEGGGIRAPGTSA
jgi:hypothetical protein